MFRTSSLTLALLSALFLYAIQAHAGPMPPCIAATLSSNGNILVTNELTVDDPGPTHLQKVTRSTFQVFSRYVPVKGVNDALNFDGPNAYWSFRLWSVVFDSTASYIGCPYTLVTNDGEFLIFVNNGALYRGNALRIYRRRDHPGQDRGGPGPDNGVLVREVPLTELWPAEHFPTKPIDMGVTDHTPQWYSGGSFAFSSDNRTLSHKTRWGTTVQIDLATGAVTGN